MVNFIRNYFIAKKVCKKYGYSYKNIFNIHNSHVNMCGKVVVCNIFSKYFLPIFFHEVGHVVEYKIRKGINKHSLMSILSLKGWYCGGKYKGSVTDVISAEYMASRFSVKLLRKLGYYNKFYLDCLIRAMNTYLIHLRYFGVQIYTDTCYKVLRKIEG